MQLFCLTFAGGSGSFFNGLEAYIGPEIELVKLEYAGHIGRHREPFYRDFGELTADMYGQIKARVRPDEPYALLGYSMGTLAAVELTKTFLERGEVSPPHHVFLASHGPCPILDRAKFSVSATDETVKEWTVRFGGLSGKLINSRTFWRMYLPIYRADYMLIAGYDFSRLDYEMSIPATALFSSEDIRCEDMEKWHSIFTGKFDMLEYDGGHFFLQGHEREVADAIRERLSRYVL